MTKNTSLVLKETKKNDILSEALRVNLQRRKAAKKPHLKENTKINTSEIGDLYIGFMSGTSCDGVDASLVRTDGENNFTPLYNIHLPYPSSFKYELKKLCKQPLVPLAIEKKLTEYHVQATQELLKLSKYSSNDIRGLGFHGQTIFHNSNEQLTWQIGNPHLLAQKTGINVIHDFRRRDISLGGQGAPLVPIFHKLLMQAQKLPVAIINIGGVANITYINQDSLIGFDTGTGNALIDDAMNKYYNKKYDDKGEIASKGKIDFSIISKVMNNDYFKQSYPKSLDRNAFEYVMDFFKSHDGADIIATLTYITCAGIASSIKLLPAPLENIFVCGGGANNIQMIEWLKLALAQEGVNCGVGNISEINNYDADYIESQAFAYLAARFCKNLPSAFATTTGCARENICGCLVKY